MSASRLSRRGRLLLAGLLAIQLVVSLVWIVPWSDLRIAEPPEFAAIAPPSLPLTLESGAELARRYADQWRPGARLVAATGRVTWPEDAVTVDVTVPGDGWNTYVFVHENQALSLSLDRVSGRPFGRMVGKWGMGEWTPLDLTTYSRSSTVAVLAAEVLAGQSFRNACPAQRRQAMVSPSRIDGVPVWTVTYRDERDGERNAIVIRVDATTGVVMSRHIEQPPCEPDAG